MRMMPRAAPIAKRHAGMGRAAQVARLAVRQPKERYKIAVT